MKNITLTIILTITLNLFSPVIQSPLPLKTLSKNFSSFGEQCTVIGTADDYKYWCVSENDID